MFFSFIWALCGVFFPKYQPRKLFQCQKAVATYNEAAMDTTSSATFVSLNKYTFLNQPGFIDLDKAEVQSVISSDEKRV